MRQWELIGITDDPAPAHRPEDTRREADHPVFLWNTDSALRLRAVGAAVTDVVGRPAERCRGRDLIGLFGMEGPNLAILEAHVAALGGATVEFELRGAGTILRCAAAPTHDDADQVTGTMCLVLETSPEAVGAAR